MSKKKTLDERRRVERLAEIGDEAEAGEQDQTVKPIPEHVKVTRGNARSKVLQVRLNPDEYAAIERIAEARGLPASTVAREALLKLVAEEDAEAQPLATLVALADRIKTVAIGFVHGGDELLPPNADFKIPSDEQRTREYYEQSPERLREYDEQLKTRINELQEMRAKGRKKQTMTEEPSTGFTEKVNELMAQSEKRMLAIQDQITKQWETQQKAIADRIEQQFEAQRQSVAKLFEQQQQLGAKIADDFETRRKALADRLEQQWEDRRKAITDMLERQWEAQKKALDDAQTRLGGMFRDKPE
ncbi:hypothetical protein [Mycobacterium sp. 852014-50255_SCH5639931]|uniref:hypothetical protein n=1 Tax=Mycobacterium sp. 852014-50255_SCH5639931 TaxID=1834112 RepID=UPI000AE519DA|nr:hypothetical protein [Mycobacterium sp. 852014-50255_SCH5639931]